MSARRAIGTIVFEGAGGRYEVPPEQWAQMLLLLEDRGWRPEQLRTSYIATELQISDPDFTQLGRDRATCSRSRADGPCFCLSGAIRHGKIL